MARLKPNQTVEANYRRILPKLLRQYFRRGRKAARRTASISDLHRFRIRTKRVRYIAELYQPLFPAEMAAAVKQLRAIQQVLGTLQDHSMVAASFEKRLGLTTNGERRAAYEQILSRAHQGQKKCQNEFQKSWAAMEKAGLEEKLIKKIRNA